MKLLYKYLFFLIIIFSFFACVEPKKELKNYNFTNFGFYITNEGNFTYGNASLSFVDLENDTIYNNVFYDVNNYPLGDVAQSITVFNDKVFIVINNSGKIFVINKNTAKYIATIKNLTSPRHITFISENKAYISDLYSNFITIINPQNYEIIGTINTGCSTEKMILLEKYIYSLNWNLGNKILKINTLTDELEDSIILNFQPNSLVVDKNSFLWVLTDGGINSDTSLNYIPKLVKININSFEIEKTYSFENKSLAPTNLCINNSKDTLFFLKSSWNNNVTNGGVYKMSINDETLPKTAFIKENTNLFYAITVSKNNQIIVSDAIDFSQPGDVFVYNSLGILKKTYKAGIIPGNFCFIN